MGLGKLIDMSETSATQQLSVRLSEDMLTHADELANELDIPRSVVLREAFTLGMQQLWGDWQQALENGKKRVAQSPYVKAKKEGKA